MHYHSYLGIFLHFTFTSSNSLLYILCKVHIHLWKKYIQLSVVKINMFSFHDIRTVSALFISFNFIKPLQYFDFSLIKSFLSRVKFVFELFDCVYLSSFNISAFIHMTKTTSSNYIILLIDTTK